MNKCVAPYKVQTSEEYYISNKGQYCSHMREGGFCAFKLDSAIKCSAACGRKIKSPNCDSCLERFKCYTERWE